MEFIEKLKDYIKKNDDFDIVNIAGSFSDKKNKNRYDEFSDIDLFIVTEKKDYYLSNKDWLSFYGKNFIYFNDPISLGTGMELRVAFDDGLLADIAIVNDLEFQKLKENKIFCEKIIDRGFTTLKNNYDEHYFEHKKYKEEVVTQYEWNRKIDEFWIDICNIYKYFVRKDYFSAKYAFDRRILKILIYTLEEYTKIKNPKQDVYFNGRYMRKWLDKESFEEMNNIDSSIEPNKMILSIQLAINMFEEKINKIFDYYGYSNDIERDSLIRNIKEKINGEIND